MPSARFLLTPGDWSQHGLLTTRWLAGQLPNDALVAIAAYDHRTGIRSDTLIADMLNLANAVAVIDKRFGRDLFTQADKGDPYATLRNHLGERAYVADILDRCASKHRLSFEHPRYYYGGAATIVRPRRWNTAWP